MKKVRLGRTLSWMCTSVRTSGSQGVCKQVRNGKANTIILVKGNRMLEAAPAVVVHGIW
jgi:hypothetical protein